MAKLKDPPAVVLTLEATKDNTILFYGHTTNKGVGPQCFSQWFPCKFTEKVIDEDNQTAGEIEYHCAEQYMMAHKALLFQDNETFAKICKVKTAKECKELGRQVKNFDQKVWDEYKEEIVGLRIRDAVRPA